MEANSWRPRIPLGASLLDYAGFLPRSWSGSGMVLLELSPLFQFAAGAFSEVILTSVRFVHKVLTPGLISCLESLILVLRHKPRLWCVTCRNLVLPLSRSRRQQLQESAVRWVYLAGWPKIHHLPRLPLHYFLLLNCFFEAMRFLGVSLVHMTCRSLPLPSYFSIPLLSSGVKCWPARRMTADKKCL